MPQGLNADDDQLRVAALFIQASPGRRQGLVQAVREESGIGVGHGFKDQRIQFYTEVIGHFKHYDVGFHPNNITVGTKLNQIFTQVPSGKFSQAILPLISWLKQVNGKLFEALNSDLQTRTERAVVSDGSPEVGPPVTVKKSGTPQARDTDGTTDDSVKVHFNTDHGSNEYASNLHRIRQEALRLIVKEEKKPSGEISFAGMGIREVPPEISRLQWLKRVTVGDSQVADLGWLASLPNVEFLDISYSRVSRLAMPKAARSLKYLMCVETPVIDFRGLDHCPNLETVNCQRTNALRTLEGIESCTQLKRLICSHNGIRSLGPLHKLKSLEELVMAYTDIFTLDGLPESETLSHLDFTRTSLRSLVGVERVSQLSTIDLHWNRLESLSPLRECRMLRHVNLRTCKIADISEDFWFNQSLVSVDLKGCSIAGVPPELIESAPGGDYLKVMRDFLR